MKKRFLLFLSVMLLGMWAMAQQTPAEQLAARHADRMKDTLGLTTQQREQIYTVNLNLHGQKMAVRQQHASTDSVSRMIQQIENQRDSLYNLVLPEQKFLLYQQRKQQLLNNN